MVERSAVNRDALWNCEFKSHRYSHTYTKTKIHVIRYLVLRLMVNCMNISGVKSVMVAVHIWSVVGNNKYLCRFESCTSDQRFSLLISLIRIDNLWLNVLSMHKSKLEKLIY